MGMSISTAEKLSSSFKAEVRSVYLGYLHVSILLFTWGLGGLLCNLSACKNPGILSFAVLNHISWEPHHLIVALPVQ